MTWRRPRVLVDQAATEIQRFFVDGRAEQVRQIARRIQGHDHMYVIGRGPSYPLALEAALKIKEVSYMHAEAFAGGEMKHGAIALIEPGTPCLVLAPNDETFRSIVSGAQEIKAPVGATLSDFRESPAKLGMSTSRLPTARDVNCERSSTTGTGV